MKKLLIHSLILFLIYYSIGCSSSSSLAYTGTGKILRYISTVYAVDGTGKSYVDLKDGQRIYGDVVDIWGNGFKIKIVVNKVKYDLDKVQDLQRGNEKFYTVFNKELYHTIVREGKVGIYLRSMSATGSSGYKSFYKLYYSKNGELAPLQSLKDISNAIGDCSVTQSVNSLTMEDLKEKSKENIRFINELFEKYNKECN